MRLESVPTQYDTSTEAVYFDHDAQIQYHQRVSSGGGSSFRFKVEGVNPASKQSALFTVDITTRQVIGCLLEMNPSEIGTWVKMMALQKDIDQLPEIVKQLAIAIRDIGGKPEPVQGKMIRVARHWNKEQDSP